MARSVTTLFLDIGGVLLTNGWDRGMRRRAAEVFGLDYAEMDERHHLTFDTYESGKLSLDEYLDRTVFWADRPYSRDAFREFMFEQSKPFPEMIQLVRDLKNRYGLKVATVSNEGRELTTFRIEKFELRTVVDFFVSSCFVHYRKPDADIYRIALDIALANPAEVIYIDDRLMFVEVARGLGIRGVHHSSCASTRAALADFGLSMD
jgi:putative hydrolase of the HAD superfamily